VTFEDPPHTNGLGVTVGAGSDRPQHAENVTAQTGIGDFTTQVALANNGGMSFFPSSPSVTGVVNISWDFAVISYSDGITTEAGMSIFAMNDSSVFLLLFNDTGVLKFSAPGLGIGPTNVATLSLGVHDNYLFSANLDASTYSFFINGSPVVESVEMGAPNSVKYVAFDDYQISTPQYAVDNFRWEVVPEPSPFVLITLGLQGVCARRFAGRRASER
jgi:hypothetical protein